MSAPEFTLDFERVDRLGFGEAILCAEKTASQIGEILRVARERGADLLLTRLGEETLAALAPGHRDGIDYHPASRTAFFDHAPRQVSTPQVAVVTAGTSDAGVAWEALRALEFHGVGATAVFDVGVAGIWRLMDRIDEIARHPVVIAVAGMDAALPSVLGGLVPGVLIAVPTSAGYGMARAGETALYSCLVSCAPGVTVCNIDNGYGAASAALRSLRASGSLRREEATKSKPRIAAVVLAAGAAGRMEGRNKLLCEINGTPMVRLVVDTVIGAEVDEVVIVTGHDAPSIAAAVAGRTLRLAHNEDYPAGMGSSLARGVAALPESVDGALICLADMPRIRSDTIRRIVSAFSPLEGKDICVPVHEGRRGHPVLFGRRFFEDLRELTGDAGGRPVMQAFGAHVVEVPVDDEGIFKDFDTLEDFRAIAVPYSKAAKG